MTQTEGQKKRLYANTESSNQNHSNSAPNFFNASSIMAFKYHPSGISYPFLRYALRRLRSVWVGLHCDIHQ